MRSARCGKTPEAKLMNYLIHAFITRNEPHWSAGNIITDMLKPKEIKTLDDSLRKGVSLHHAIDSYSDAHRSVRRSTKRLRSSQGKYAPVAVDLLYDFLLGQDWDTYNSISFQTFVHTIYGHLDQHMSMIPNRIRQVIKKMVEGKWLNDYNSEEGFQRVLYRMDRRASFPSRFARLPDDITEYREDFEKDFHQFLPELTDHMEKQMG